MTRGNPDTELTSVLWSRIWELQSEVEKLTARLDKLTIVVNTMLRLPVEKDPT